MTFDFRAARSDGRVVAMHSLIFFPNVFAISCKNMRWWKPIIPVMSQMTSASAWGHPPSSSRIWNLEYIAIQSLDVWVQVALGINLKKKDFIRWTLTEGTSWDTGCRWRRSINARGRREKAGTRTSTSARKENELDSTGSTGEEFILHSQRLDQTDLVYIPVTLLSLKVNNMSLIVSVSGKVFRLKMAWGIVFYYFKRFLRETTHSKASVAIAVNLKQEPIGTAISKWVNGSQE